MKADTLSHCPDFNTGNSSNDHLIVLPLDQFKGMPQSVLQALSIPLDMSLNVLGIEDEGFNANHLKAKVKLYQDDHYREITPLIKPHNLQINSNNYLWKDSTLIVMENNNLRRGILHHFHSSITTGHPGIAKTIQLIQPYYWWPHMKDFVTNYVKGCMTCQMNKINTHPMQPPLYPITSTLSLPFQTVAMDFITKLPSSYGHDTILTITDYDVSKASIFLPCKETIDAVGIAALYATHVFPHYRIPLQIISDRDLWFNLKFTTKLCKLLSIHQNISTTYHPQTNGQSEWTNQSLESYL